MIKYIRSDRSVLNGYLPICRMRSTFIRIGFHCVVTVFFLIAFVALASGQPGGSEPVVSGSPDACADGTVYYYSFFAPGPGSWQNCEWTYRGGESVFPFIPPPNNRGIYIRWLEAGPKTVGCRCTNTTQGLIWGNNLEVAVAGTSSIAIDEVNSCDNTLTGTVNAQITGSVVRWERSYDDGATWQSISATTNSYPYSESQRTSFRVIVTGPNCGEVVSASVTAIPIVSDPAEIEVTTINSTCTEAAVRLTAGGYNGSIQFWEKSIDSGNNWTQVSTSGGSQTLNQSVTVPTKFRVATQTLSCGIVYSSSVDAAPKTALGGTLSASASQFNCGASTATIVLSAYRGDRFTWQSSTDGINWTTMSGLTSLTSRTVSVSQDTYYRVSVDFTFGDCIAVVSSVYFVPVSSKGGVATSSSNGPFCGQVNGQINLSNDVGTIVRWEYSTDGSSWNTITGSSAAKPLTISTSSPNNYYRAVLQLQSCPIAYSTVESIDVNPATQAGRVRLVDEEKDAVASGGQLTFYPIFELQNYLGDIQTWWQYQGGGQVAFPSTSSIVKPIVISTTAFRAEVNSSNCGALLSGSATFVVNAPALGVEDLVQGRNLSEYEGYSYQVKTGDVIEMKEGFSFQANSAQNFFVLLDDNYAIPVNDHNYVLEEVVLREGIESESELYFANAYHRKSTTTYLDGLGREMQKVSRRANPSENDVVFPIEYDAIGRVEKDYLPFISPTHDGYFYTEAVAAQAAFYENPPDKISASNYPFSHRIFESGPLDRILEQGAPGTTWQPIVGHSVKFNYKYNLAGEVHIWNIDPITDRPVSNGFYAANQLTIKVTTNENSFITREYYNKEDVLLLRRRQSDNGWNDTYNIYDGRGMLRFILQPEGVAQLVGDPDQEFLDKWAFQYKYDGRRRLVEKRVPGSGWQFMVYDQRDRLILSQNGRQRINNEWIFIKYDALNRVVVTGIHNATLSEDPSHIASREEIASRVSVQNVVETYDGSGPLYGYTNVVYPTESLDVLAINYYDNYDFLASYGPGFAYSSLELDGLAAVPLSSVKGYVTGGYVRVLGTPTFTKNVTWYSKKYHPIQTISSDHLGGIDRVSKLFDFSEKVVRSRRKNIREDITIDIVEDFTYDHAGRLLAHYHSVNDQPRVLLRALQYNDLGQLVERNLHQKDDGAFIQSEDYRYNIRGWLTQINNGELVADGHTNDDSDDLFGMDFRYESPEGNGISNQYNGNISEIVWRGIGLHKQAYGYAYDPLDRIKEAKHRNLTDPLLNGRFTERVSSYDQNGNIRALQRFGEIEVNTFGEIDDLAYTYEGNRLLSVIDNSDHADVGFVDGNILGNDFGFDNQGNMVDDKNKGIVLNYNALGLPSFIEKQSGDFIEFGYSSSGDKLYQITSEGGETSRIDYVKGLLYSDGALHSIDHVEGRILPSGNDWEYQYFLKDHIGNTRAIFTAEPGSENNLATLESENIEAEEPQFQYYDEAIVVNQELFDHTHLRPGATSNTYYATRLLGGASNSTYGLSKSLCVMPGDKVKIRVYAKYIDSDLNSLSGDLKDFLLSIALNGGAPTGTIIDGGGVGSVGSNVILPETVIDHSDDMNTGVPKAYLNYIMFDRDFNSILPDVDPSQTNFIRITEDGRETGLNGGHHEELYAEITVKQQGYLKVYLSNESATETEVYFDDFEVEHIHSILQQTDDYYPFGLTYNEFKRDYVVENRRKFQEQEHISELELNWDSFKWRNHQPEIGRFFNIDPLADDYVYNSPYAFSENKVTTHVELEGLEAVWIGKVGQHVAENPNGSAAAATGFIVGLYNSTIGGIANMIKDPVGTVGGIAKMAPNNLEGAVEVMTGAVIATNQKVDQVQNGNAFEKAVVYGEVVGTVADIAIGTKGTAGAGALKDVAKFTDLPLVGKIDPSIIRFSQDNINSVFKNGGKVSDLTKGLLDGSIDPNSVPAIRIVEKDGLIFTLDNRRLKAFQDAGMPINYQKLESIPKSQMKKFSTENGGTSIVIRKKQ